MSRRQSAEGFKSNKKARKQVKRAQDTKDERERLIIACEGIESERIYFKNIFNDLKKNHAIAASSLIIAKHKHTDPSGVLQDLLDTPDYQDFDHQWM